MTPYQIGRQFAIKVSADLWNPVNDRADDLMSGLKRDLRGPAVGPAAGQAPLRSAANVHGTPVLGGGTRLGAPPMTPMRAMRPPMVPTAGQPVMQGLSKVVSGEAPAASGFLARLLGRMR